MANQKYQFLIDKFYLENTVGNVFCGKINGFYTVVVCDDAQNTVKINIGANLKSDPTLDEKIQELKKSCKCSKFNFLQYAIKAEMGSNAVTNNLPTFLEELTAYLRDNGYESGCFESGSDDGTVRLTEINGEYFFLSQGSYDQILGSLEDKKQLIKQKGENIPLGIIGAAAGAIIGGLLWAFIGVLGYYAWFAGFATIFLAFKGYELLGKKVSIAGAVIVFVISIAAIFGGSVLEWTWNFYNTLKEYYIVTFFEVLPETLPLIFEEPELKGKFLMDIGIGIGAVLIIGIPMLVSMYSDSSGKYSVKRY